MASSLSMKPLAQQLKKLGDVRSGQSHANSQDGLTTRHLEVLRLIGLGQTNREIAETLDISPNTVARHVANIYECEQAGRSNRVRLAQEAKARGLLDP